MDDGTHEHYASGLGLAVVEQFQNPWRIFLGLWGGGKGGGRKSKYGQGFKKPGPKRIHIKSWRKPDNMELNIRPNQHWSPPSPAATILRPDLRLWFFFLSFPPDFQNGPPWRTQ